MQNSLIKSFLRPSRFTMFSNLPFSFIAVVPVTDAEHTLLNVHFSMDPGPNFVWGRDEYDQGKMAGLLQSGKDFFRNGRNTSSNLILMTLHLKGPKLHPRCVIFGQLIRYTGYFFRNIFVNQAKIWQWFHINSTLLVFYFILFRKLKHIPNQLENIRWKTINAEFL